MITKLYSGTVRHRLEKMIERTLSDRMGFISDKLNDLLQGAANTIEQKYEETVQKTIQPLTGALLSSDTKISSKWRDYVWRYKYSSCFLIFAPLTYFNKLS